MDEDETGYITMKPMTHDRWSVLILALNVATNIFQDLSDGMAAGSMIAAQHANQKIYDRKFNEITREQ